MRTFFRLAVFIALFPALLAAARVSDDALGRCNELQPTTSTASAYSSQYAICLASINENKLAAREFEKNFGSHTAITPDNVVEATVFSSVIAKTAGIARARPWWYRILRLYFSAAEVASPKLGQFSTFDDEYATVQAVRGRFREALSAYAAFAKVNIVGMSEDLFFDNDRTVSDRIVEALNDGSKGHFRSCYIKLDALTADKWQQHRPLFAGVCAQAAGDSVQARRHWFVCLQKYSSISTSERLTLGDCALQSMQLLLKYAH